MTARRPRRLQGLNRSLGARRAGRRGHRSPRARGAGVKGRISALLALVQLLTSVADDAEHFAKLVLHALQHLIGVGIGVALNRMALGEGALAQVVALLQSLAVELLTLLQGLGFEGRAFLIYLQP